MVEYTSAEPQLNLIRDRTSNDVARIKYLLSRLDAGTATEAERQEFLEPSLKGAYNYTDLNRVGAAVRYVADRLYTECGAVASVTAKRDWTESDVPTLDQMETYLADVSAIRGALTLPDTVPPVPADMDGLTYLEANNIEQIIWDVNEIIFRFSPGWLYAGEVISGEV